MERVIRARGPFRFDLAIRYFASSPSTIAERVDDGRYRRAFENGILTVESAPRGVRACVDGGASLERAALFASRAFGLQNDPTGIESVAERDPLVGTYVHRYAGLRPVTIPDPFEALVWAILGQQINIGFAAKMKRALIERYGVRGAGGLWQFPPPDVLGDVTVEELRPLQISRQKATYIRELSRSGMDLERLRGLPDDEVIAELVRLPGIGRWTAEYLLLRCFGRPDAIPAGDMGIRAVVGRLHGLGRNATEAEVRTLAERWAPWRGFVGFYLWFALQQREY